MDPSRRSDRPQPSIFLERVRPVTKMSRCFQGRRIGTPRRGVTVLPTFELIVPVDRLRLASSVDDIASHVG